MKQLFNNHIVQKISQYQQRQQLIKTQYRALFKQAYSIKKYDSVLGVFLQAEISKLYRENQNESKASDQNELIFKEIIKDFETTPKYPSKYTINAIRNAYNQSGKTKTDTVKTILMQNKYSPITMRETIKENFVYNIPVKQEKKQQILLNSTKYNSLYENLFIPSYEDFIEPNKSLLFDTKQ